MNEVRSVFTKTLDYLGTLYQRLASDVFDARLINFDKSMLRALAIRKSVSNVGFRLPCSI